MGVTRKVLKPGNGVDKPQKGDEVTIEYTGNLYDADKAAGDYRGKEFDSSKGRGPFKTSIGVGKVIKGWDEGVVQMTLGEKSILTISGYVGLPGKTPSPVRIVLMCIGSDYAYGDRGFPNLIPPNSSLVFEVELKAINQKKA